MNITKEQFSKFTPRYKEDWLCPSSYCVRQKTDSNTTPARTATSTSTVTFSPSQNVGTTRGSKTKDETLTTTATCEFSVANLIAEIRQLRQELSEVRQEIKIQSTSFNQTLEERLVEYTKINQAKDIEIAELKASVYQLKQIITTQEQHSIKNELEIIGLPEEDNENLTHLVLLTSQKVGVKLTETDLDEVTRIGPKRSSELSKNGDINIPRPIVVKLLRRQKRDELVKAARIRRNITSENISSKPPQKFFINERLTKTNRELFREARQAAKKNGFRFCWVRHGNIYIKESEGKETIRIHSQEDLVRKFGTNNDSTV